MKTDIALIEQLRQACSVALGDLLAHGMPVEASTGKMLLEAIRAAATRLAQTDNAETPS